MNKSAESNTTLLQLFWSFIKTQDDPPIQTMPIYEAFESIYVKSQNGPGLLAISNQLFTIGSKLRTTKNATFLDYWQRAVSLEQQHIGLIPANKSNLLSKAERTSVALKEQGFLQEAVDLLFCAACSFIDSQHNHDVLSESYKSVATALRSALNTLLRLVTSHGAHFSNSTSKSMLTIYETLLIQRSATGLAIPADVTGKILEGVLNASTPQTWQKVLHCFILSFKISNNPHPQLEKVLNEAEQSLNIVSEGTSLPYNLYFRALTYGIRAMAIESDSTIIRSLLQKSAATFTQLFAIKLPINADCIDPQVRLLVDFMELHELHAPRVDILTAYLDVVASKGWTYLCLARSYLQQGLVREATQYLSALETASELDDIENAEALAQAVLMYVHTGQLDAASTSYASLARQLDGSSRLRNPFSEDSAVEHAILRRKLRLYGEVSIAYCRLSSSRGRHDQGIAALARCLKVLQAVAKRSPGPHSWDILSTILDGFAELAEEYEKIGLPRDSIAYVKDALRWACACGCASRLVKLRSMESVLYIRMGSMAKAQETIKELDLIGTPEDTLSLMRASSSKALLYQRAGDIAKEKELITSLVELAGVEESKTNENSDIAEVTRSVSRLHLDAESCSSTFTERLLSQTLLSYAWGASIHGDVEVVTHALELWELAGLATADKWHDYIGACDAFFSVKKSLSLDPIYGVIQDSALSIPSASKCKVVNTEVAGQLSAVAEVLLERFCNDQSSCSFVESQNVSSLLGETHMLLSAIAPDNTDRFFSRPGGMPARIDRQILRLKQKEKESYNWPSFELSDDKTTGELMPGVSEVSHLLPRDWVLISASVAEESGNLVLSRYDNLSESSLSVALPLNRHAFRDFSEEPFTFDDGLKLLDEIVAASNASAHVSRTSTIKTPEQRRAWWRERFELESRLDALLKDADYSWLGGFRGIFGTALFDQDTMHSFISGLTEILDSYLQSRTKSSKAEGKRSASRRGRRLRDVQIDHRVAQLFLGLGDPDELTDPSLLEDLVFFVLDILQFHGEQNAYDELDDGMIVQIQDLLKAFYHRDRDGRESASHVILMLDKKTNRFPWESMPVLRGQSVSRVPSMKILKDLLNGNSMSSGTRVNDVYYVLNPSRDLVKTQARFETTFRETPGWTGRMCEAPTEAEIAKALQKRDLFVYMGHGGGEQYIRSATIKSLDRCCPTLLLGCSSGKMQLAGDYDSWGTPINYLVAGCPMVVVNMWDVTDKDIDAFGTKLMATWGLVPKAATGVSMGAAVAAARDACTLKYLNGGAPVVYGLPLALS